MFKRLYTLLLLFLIGCGSATSTTPASIPIAIEGMDGATDVDAGSSFIYDFYNDKYQDSVIIFDLLDPKLYEALALNPSLFILSGSSARKLKRAS